MLAEGIAKSEYFLDGDVGDVSPYSDLRPLDMLYFELMMICFMTGLLKNQTTFFLWSHAIENNLGGV